MSARADQDRSARSDSTASSTWSPEDRGRHDASPAGAEGDDASSDDAIAEGDGGRFARWFGPLTWLKLATLLAAALFLGGAMGYLVRDAESQASSAVDVGFLQDMTVHHQQALAIAKTALYGDLPEGVGQFADEVITQQSMEIGLMRATLYRLNEPAEGDGTAMGWMGMPVPVDEMPGMASPEELTQLEALDGDEAAELFFALMTRHHLGGLHMAEAAARDAEDPWVRELASRMAQGQQAEIVEYRAARERLGLGLPEGYDETPSLEIPAAAPTDEGSGRLVPILLVAVGFVLAAAISVGVWRRRSPPPQAEGAT